MRRSRWAPSRRADRRRAAAGAGRIAALAAALLASAARAGPPYVTDDPEPVEHRHVELYLATQGGTDRHGGVATTAPHVEVNYGAAPDLQLHLVAPLVYARPSGGPAAYGYGDTELGAKLRLVHEGDRVPQVGVFPLLELPTGDAARGLGAGAVQIFLPVWLQKSIGRWLTYGGAGYWLDRAAGARSWWLAGWHLEAKLGAVSPGFEVFHATSRAAGEPGETRANLGVVVDLSERHHLLASAGRTLATGAAAPQWYLGYQLTVGP